MLDSDRARGIAGNCEEGGPGEPDNLRNDLGVCCATLRFLDRWEVLCQRQLRRRHLHLCTEKKRVPRHDRRLCLRTAKRRSGSGSKQNTLVIISNTMRRGVGSGHQPDTLGACVGLQGHDTRLARAIIGGDPPQTGTGCGVFFSEIGFRSSK